MRIYRFLSLAFMMTICIFKIYGQEPTIAQQNGFIFNDANTFKEGLAGVKHNGKWGFINYQGDVIVKFEYDDTRYFKNGYCAVKKGNKWGAIDKKGNIVVPIKYDEVGNFEEGLASVKLNGKWGFVSTAGVEVVPIKYSSKTFDTCFNHYFKNGYSTVSISSDKGIYQVLIDKTGTIKTPIERYASVGDLCDGLAKVLFIYIDNNKRISKWGFINNAGTEVIKPSFESVEDFCDGYALVQNNLKTGIIDKTGKLVVPCIYDILFNELYPGGIAKVMKDDKAGLIDVKGNVILPFKYDGIYLGKEGLNGLISIKTGNKYGWADKSGKVVIQERYDNCTSFRNGYATVCVKSIGGVAKWGVIDKNGNVKIPIVYAELSGDWNGYYTAKYNGKYGFIDNQGNPLIVKIPANEMYNLGAKKEDTWRSKNTKDYLDAAMVWYKKSAEAGYGPACFKVGVYNYTGELGKKNYSEAVKWLEKCKNSGFNTNGNEYAYLGYCYSEGGYGLVKDENKAFEYYQSGAKKNNEKCYYALAVSYINGYGCVATPQEACNYAEKLYIINKAQYATIYGQSYNALAYEYAKKKDYDQAIVCIDKAISAESNPSNIANYYDSKGEIYLMMGNEAEALNMWNKVMEYDKDNLQFYKTNSELYKQLKSKGKI